MTILESALKAASMGFHIHPLRPKSKIAVLKNWPEKATRDEATIREWFAKNPEFNYGICTSKFNESEALIVVDVDQKEGKMGEDELLRLEIQGFDFPTTLSQRTPSGGRHLIYKTNCAVKQGVNVLAPGIDIRSDGGYVVGFGSVLSNGEYVLSDGEILEATPRLVSSCGRPITKPETRPPQRAYSVNRENAISRARDYLTTSAPVATQGAGGDQTTFAVAARIKDFGLDSGDCFELMSEWNSNCNPPWGPTELQEKISNAYRYGEKPQGIDSPEADFSPVISIDKKKKGLFFTPFSEIQHQSDGIFLVEKLLSPGAMSVVYGESNSGKTFFCLDMALHLAANRDWMGRKVNGGGVVYIAAEGGWGIKKRVVAFRKFHSMDGVTVPFSLIPCSIDLFSPAGNTKELIDMIQKEIETQNQKTVLIVVDTLSRAMGSGNENTPNDMGALVKNFDAIRSATQAHLMVIHHSGKDAARGARGHSSLKAATDTEIEIAGSIAKITKQRDQEYGPSIEFRLQQVALENDQTSCVIQPAYVSAIKDFSAKAPAKNSLAEKGLSHLRNFLERHGEAPKNEMGLSDEHLIGSFNDWREEFLKEFYATSPKQTKSMAILRLVQALLQTGLVAKNEDYIWIK